MEYGAPQDTVPAASVNPEPLLVIMENEEINTSPVAPEVAPAPVTQPSPTVDTRNRVDAARQYAEEQYDKLRRATAAQVENVRGYTQEARRQLHEGWEEARHHLNEGWEEARHHINEGWDATRTKAKDLHHAGEEYVRANPSGSILGAVGLGIILGLLIGGRRH